MTLGVPAADPSFEARALATVLALCNAVIRTLTITRALIEGGQRIDLSGLDRAIGLLCAKALDLPPEMGRAVRPSLTAMLREIDEITLALSRCEPG